ncbi:MAG: hypothetical protein AAGG09_13665 [Pseudomonadota bacterium]
MRASLPSVPVILSIALLARLLWAGAVPMVLYSDPAAYDALARNLAAHGIYGWDTETATAFWAVGAAAFYGAAYAVAGPSAAVVATLNIALSLAIVWLTIAVISDWFGPRTGRLAGLFVALWPALIQFVTFPNSELLFTALLLAALWAWGRAGATVSRGAFTGLLLGAATLVRPIALLVPVVLAIAPRPMAEPSSPRLVARSTAALLAFLCIGLVVAPWSLRNQAVFGELVIVSTNFGPNLWMGNNPETTGRYQPLPEDTAQMDEITRDAHLRSEAVAYIRSDPAAFAKRFVTKIGYLFSRETTGVTWNARGLTTRYGPGVVAPLKAISTAYWYAMLALAGLGVVRLIRQRGALPVFISIPVALIGYFAAVHGVIFVSDRFHLPLNPLVAGLAAFALLGPRTPAMPRPG